MEQQRRVNYWQFILLAHLSVLLAFAIIRGMQIAYCSGSLKEHTKFLEYLECFGRGLVFDNHCSLIALIPVALVLGIQSIRGKEIKWVSTAGFWITAAIYFIELGICCSNVVYVKYQSVNLNFEAVTALGLGTEVLKMMTSGTYVVAFIIGMVYCSGVVCLLYFLFKRYVKEGEQSRKGSIALFVILSLLIFVGVRGRSENIGNRTSTFNKVIGVPLNTSFAEYSNQSLLNLSSMNAFFFVEKSWIYAFNGVAYKYMSPQQAKEIAMRYQNYPHEADANSIKQNQHVILVLMEGISAKLMKTFGYPKDLTPFLDSIHAKSLSYDNFYSAGVITQKGMCATFSAVPTFSSFHSMKSLPKRRTVISTAFHDEGYTTQFFISHSASFDNVFGFFENDPFDYKYDKYDYPSKYWSLNWGPPDEIVYDLAFDKTHSLISSGAKKTFSVIYGCSNHPPYLIPKEYYKKDFSEEDAAVYYADAQLKRFYSKVRSTEWGKNALIVFVADHGKNYVPNIMTCNHIPFIINHPELEPRVDSTVGVQYDLLPTLLALSGINYKDYLGYGIDLARSKRDTVFFGCGEMYFLKTKEKLYLYTPESSHSEVFEDNNGEFNFIGDRDDSFETYMKANLQYGYKFATSN